MDDDDLDKLVEQVGGSKVTGKSARKIASQILTIILIEAPGYSDQYEPVKKIFEQMRELKASNVSFSHVMKQVMRQWEEQ